MKIRIALLGYGIVTTIIAVSISCFCAAFFLTAFIFKNTGTDSQLPNLLLQIINLLIATFIFMALGRFFLKIFNPVQYAKHRKVGIFGLVGMIVKAMEQIARGDFNVRLEPLADNNDTFGELVQGMNHMALELSRIEKMRQEFIANVSHEIQSPLTSIRGFAQVLRNDLLSQEERLHYLSIIEAESMRLSKLTDNLLRLASLEAEMIAFEPKSYRLDKQLRNLILVSEPQWVAKQIEMEVFMDELTITADEEMISQVWLNLLHNSIKYTPVGGRVRVDLSQRGDKIEFTISDTGIGIAEADQPQIFERFYKADKSREYSNKGSGLGLSIVKKIIELHHGAISVQSKLGEGSIFTVTLPIE
jgi:two-component system phosphate regulon sensor histidine kinase PhoR